LGAIKVLMLSAMTFAGNANIFKLIGLQQFFSFPMAIVLSALYLPMMRINFELLKLVLMLLFITYFLFVNMYQHVAADLYYSIWPINCFFLGIFFAEFLKKIDSIDVRPFLVLPLFIILGLLVTGLENRASFIFGPNILYRIFLLCGAILIFYSKTSFYRFLGLMIMVFGAATGSRGYIAGLIVVILFSIFIFSNDKKSNSINKLVFLLISVPVLALIFSDVVNERIFFFDANSLASLNRLNTFEFVFSNWETLFNFTGLDSFELSKYFGYGDRIAYPHNFMLEAYLYYGFIGIVLTLLILLMAFFSAKDLKQTCLFILIFTFCSLSGDFGDNFIIFSFCFGLILNRVSNVEEKKSPA